jgi:hypothetical protein
VETSAIAELTAAFDETAVAPMPDASGQRDIVVTTWPSVPVEIVRAAGLRPVIVRGSSAATPVADAHLEADIFPSRLRQLVEAALTDRLVDVARVVLPRTSEPDYKCFLYLREFVRRGTARRLAPTVLFDLLQSNGAHVRAYGAGRVQALFDDLAPASGPRPDLEAVRREIARTNVARAAARRLAALRAGAPRVSGTEVFPLLGAFWRMAPDRYATLANAAADAMAGRTPLAGPRVLLTGAPVDTPALHAAVEWHGGVVVAEAGPWASGAAQADVPVDAEPLAALADACRTQSVGARTPVEAVWRWTERQLGAVDAVVVSLPPDDTVFGWDYPWLRDRLRARAIPHCCLYGDPHLPPTSAEHARLHALVAGATRVHEASHG